MGIATEILIILILLAANGLFAMAELALVSARKSNLRQRAEKGEHGARAALQLAENPTRFLATVQFGITLVGVLAGAFGGATLSEEIAALLAGIPLLAEYADAVAIAIVVAGITFVSLILGELIPKRIALANPEGIASTLALPLDRLLRIASPLVDLLAGTTDLALRWAGFRPIPGAHVSEEEIRGLVQEGVEAGVFATAEPAMVESVLALDRTPVRQIMTPRAQLIFLRVDEPHEAFWHKIVVSAHSAFPVYEENRDNIVGLVSVKAIYANLAAGIEIRLKDLVTPPIVLPSVQPVSQVLESFRRTGRHAALVADEFGGIIGMVTLVDVLEAIVGEVPSPEDRLRPRARQRPDGSWLADGLLEVEEVEKLTGLRPLREDGDGEYETLAGFLFCRLGRVPAEGEHLLWKGWRFEVIDMDRHRVDKVLLTPAPQPPTTPAAGAAH